MPQTHARRSSAHPARSRTPLGPLRCAAILLAGLAAQPAAARVILTGGNECDTLAQPPHQAMGPMLAYAEGVGYATLRAAPAQAACKRAMAEAPSEMRFVAYAARAADKAGNPREAARLYRIAADAGNMLAQNNLGAMHEAGEGGLPRNPLEAARLYRLSADQGFPGGLGNLGTYYAFARGGLPRDDREAVRLWQLAADEGDGQSQNNLGIMYAQGRGGLPRDNQQAARMWRLSAEQGNTEARNNLRKLGVRP